MDETEEANRTGPNTQGDKPYNHGKNGPATVIPIDIP